MSAAGSASHWPEAQLIGRAVGSHIYPSISIEERAREIQNGLGLREVAQNVLLPQSSGSSRCWTVESNGRKCNLERRLIVVRIIVLIKIQRNRKWLVFESFGANLHSILSNGCGGGGGGDWELNYLSPVGKRYFLTDFSTIRSVLECGEENKTISGSEMNKVLLWWSSPRNESYFWWVFRGKAAHVKSVLTWKVNDKWNARW